MVIMIQSGRACAHNRKVRKKAGLPGREFMPEPKRGNLSENSFARVYYTVAGHGGTGVMDIVDEKDDMVRKRIYFLAGDTSYVKYGPLNESLGQILVHHQIITEDQLEEILDEEALSHKPLGQIIIGKGLIDKERLEDMMRLQTELKLISCFAYTDGKFIFKEESVARFNHDVPMYKVVPEHIVYRGVFEHYSLERLEKQFEHLREKGIKLGKEAGARIDRIGFLPEEKEFALLLSEGKAFGQIIGSSRLGLTRSLKILYTLLVTGMLEVSDVYSLKSYKAGQSKTVRREPRTIELENVADVEGELDKAGVRISPAPRAAGASPPAAAEELFADDSDADFASVVGEHLSKQIEESGAGPMPSRDLAKYEDENKHLVEGNLAEILMSNPQDAREALLSLKVGEGVNRIGEMMVQNKVIEGSALQAAFQHMRQNGESFLNSLVSIGAVEAEQLHDFLSTQFNVPAVKLSELELDQEIVSMLPESFAVKYKAIPINRTGNTLVVAMADPKNIEAVDEMKFLTEYNIETVVATEAEIREAIDRYHDSADLLDEVMANFDDSDIETATYEDDFDIGEVERDSGAAPVVKLVNQVMADAIGKGASDIHFEPYENAFRVRYRIDGVLYHVLSPPLKLKNALVSRVKIMAGLDIAERRLPQDGRISIRMKKKKIDFRVSTLPTLYGEKLVLRILDKESLELDLTRLGFEEEQLEDFKWAISQPYGMVLVTGPSGSGKTTTLYSALIELNKITDNISTAEDPVEYYLEGINQVQMHDEIGLNFAFTLRSFLRQDPDIIMVGEIRDFETAEIAVKAALTGHIVLSTVHTNDAPGTVNRLLNMGVEPFLITASLNAVASQRLVRRLCDSCKEPEEIDKDVLINVGVPPEEVDDFVSYKAVGCPACQDRGYKGRLGLYEVMPLKGDIAEFVLAGATPSELKREAMRRGMRTMRQTGLRKAKEGLTTIEEVTRTTMPDFIAGAEGYEDINE